jgi:hypothetical protein
MGEGVKFSSADMPRRLHNKFDRSFSFDSRRGLARVSSIPLSLKNACGSVAIHVSIRTAA